MAQLAQSAPNAVPGRRGGKSAEAFRTISEVAHELEIPQHVLRFWESKFTQVKPLKRGGGRRYYRPEDVVLLHNIRTLLYQEGYTIKGVQKLLREGHARRAEADAAADGGGAGSLNDAQRREIRAIIDELTELKKLLAG
ncbi:MAG: MerR family transcriptional regulator [Alphaproteobacteria bacterium]